MDTKFIVQNAAITLLKNSFPAIAQMGQAKVHHLLKQICFYRGKRLTFKTFSYCLLSNLKFVTLQLPQIVLVPPFGVPEHKVAPSSALLQFLVSNVST